MTKATYPQRLVERIPAPYVATTATLQGEAVYPRLNLAAREYVEYRACDVAGQEEIDVIHTDEPHPVERLFARVMRRSRNTPATPYVAARVTLTARGTIVDVLGTFLAGRQAR